jgi:DNA-binding HxlR family transcriptional regulator
MEYVTRKIAIKSVAPWQAHQEGAMPTTPPTGSFSLNGDRPIMVLLDLISRRWALRILWELRDGPLTSRALRSRCDDVSPTVLQTRLSELRRAGIVDHLPRQGYALTPVGTELGAVLLQLNKVSEVWASGVPDE